MEIEFHVWAPSLVFMTPASRLGYCVPVFFFKQKTAYEIPQIALGSGGRLGVMSVHVLPSCVRHKRWRRVIEPTQPSVGLEKLMQRSQVSAPAVCWMVQFAPASSVCTIWPALFTPQPI